MASSDRVTAGRGRRLQAVPSRGGEVASRSTPAHKFRKRDTSALNHTSRELWRALKRSPAASSCASRSCSKSRLGFARRSKRSAATVLRPAADPRRPHYQARRRDREPQSSRQPKRRFRDLARGDPRLWMTMTPPGILRRNAPYACCAKSLPRACATDERRSRCPAVGQGRGRRTRCICSRRAGCG